MQVNARFHPSAMARSGRSHLKTWDFFINKHVSVELITCFHLWLLVDGLRESVNFYIWW